MTKQQRIVMELRSLANKVELGHCRIGNIHRHRRGSWTDMSFGVLDTRPVDYYDPDIYELHGEERDETDL